MNYPRHPRSGSEAQEKNDIIQTLLTKELELAESNLELLGSDAPSGLRGRIEEKRLDLESFRSTGQIPKSIIRFVDRIGSDSLE